MDVDLCTNANLRICFASAFNPHNCLKFFFLFLFTDEFQQIKKNRSFCMWCFCWFTFFSVIVPLFNFIISFRLLIVLRQSFASVTVCIYNLSIISFRIFPLSPHFRVYAHSCVDVFFALNALRRALNNGEIHYFIIFEIHSNRCLFPMWAINLFSIRYRYNLSRILNRIEISTKFIELTGDPHLIRLAPWLSLYQISRNTHFIIWPTKYVILWLKKTGDYVYWLVSGVWEIPW